MRYNNMNYYLTTSASFNCDYDTPIDTLIKQFL